MKTKYRVKYRYLIEGRRFDWNIKFFDDFESANNFVEYLKRENELVGHEKNGMIILKEMD